jgi:hypothetical protein
VFSFISHLNAAYFSLVPSHLSELKLVPGVAKPFLPDPKAFPQCEKGVLSTWFWVFLYEEPICNGSLPKLCCPIEGETKTAELVPPTY